MFLLKATSDAQELGIQHRSAYSPTIVLEICQAAGREAVKAETVFPNV